MKLTPLRRMLLERAARYSLRELPPNEEKAAFALSRLGLLYFHGIGPIDYSITDAGRSALNTAEGGDE